jgi:hypothetical protein
MVFAIKSVKIVDESTEEHGKQYSLSYRRVFLDIDDINAVIKPLMYDLSKYGLSVFIQATFDSILHLAGIGHAVGGLIKVKDISKGIIKDLGREMKGLFKVEKSSCLSE